MSCVQLTLPLFEWPAKAISGSKCLKMGQSLLAEPKCAE